MSSEQVNMKKVVMGALLVAFGSAQVYSSSYGSSGVSNQAYVPTSIPSSVTIGGSSLIKNNAPLVDLSLSPNLGLAPTVSPVVNQQTGGILNGGLIGGNNIPVSVSNTQGIVSGLPLGAISNAGYTSSAVGNVVEGVVDKVSNLGNAGQIVGGLPYSGTAGNVAGIVGNTVNTVTGTVGNLGNTGYFVGNVVPNVGTVGVSNTLGTVSNVVHTATNTIPQYSNIGYIAGNVVPNVGSGSNVLGTAGNILNTASNAVNNVVDLGNAGYVLGNVANPYVVNNGVGTVSGIANNAVGVGGVLNGLTGNLSSNNVVLDNLGNVIGVINAQNTGGLVNVGNLNLPDVNLNTGVGTQSYSQTNVGVPVQNSYQGLRGY